MFLWLTEDLFKPSASDQPGINRAWSAEETTMFLIRKDRQGNPLIIWVNPPGLNAELTPTRARELAEQLQTVASCAEENKDKKADP